MKQSNFSDLEPPEYSVMEKVAEYGYDHLIKNEQIQLALELIGYKYKNPGFNKLSDLFAAPKSQLKETFSDDQIARLGSIKQLSAEFLKEGLKEKSVVASPEAVREYLQLHLLGREEEHLVCIFLDSRNQVIKSDIISSGTVGQCVTYPRQIAKASLETNATSVIMVHNHPSGKIEPSCADIRLTELVNNALGSLDIKLFDHMIVGGNDYFSFAEECILDSPSRHTTSSSVGESTSEYTVSPEKAKSKSHLYKEFRIDILVDGNSISPFVMENHDLDKMFTYVSKSMFKDTVITGNIMEIDGPGYAIITNGKLQKKTDEKQITESEFPNKQQIESTTPSLVDDGGATLPMASGPPSQKSSSDIFLDSLKTVQQSEINVLNKRIASFMGCDAFTVSDLPRTMEILDRTFKSYRDNFKKTGYIDFSKTGVLTGVAEKDLYKLFDREVYGYFEKHFLSKAEKQKLCAIVPDSSKRQDMFVQYITGKHMTFPEKKPNDVLHLQAYGIIKGFFNKIIKGFFNVMNKKNELEAVFENIKQSKGIPMCFKPTGTEIKDIQYVRDLDLRGARIENLGTLKKVVGNIHLDENCKVPHQSWSKIEIKGRIFVNGMDNTEKFLNIQSKTDNQITKVSIPIKPKQIAPISRQDLQKTVDVLDMEIMMMMKTVDRPESFKVLVKDCQDYLSGKLELSPKEYQTRTIRSLERCKKDLTTNGHTDQLAEIKQIENKLATGINQIQSLNKNKGMSVSY